MLKQLIPIEIKGVFDGDLTVEGDSLDASAAWVLMLLQEMFIQTASLTISDWETRYAIVPAVGETLQERQASVLGAIRARGGLSIPYFVGLAQAWGYTIAIEELPRNSTDPEVPEGFSGAASTVVIWRVHPIDGSTIYFRAGQSCAGEPLVLAPSQDALQTLFQKLKPADTVCLFAVS